METARIAELLQPFLTRSLAESQLHNISMYVDLLLRWNARVNLTAVRKPEEIVTRHFGESLFAARHLIPPHPGSPAEPSQRVVDVGSGAGFPGLPIKLWAHGIHLTLIESNHKKAAFLREVIGTLTLMNVDVFARRAEEFPTASAKMVTLRAVERFDSTLPTAARLVAGSGHLALLISQRQVARTVQLLPTFRWQEAQPIPLSSARVLMIGTPKNPVGNEVSG